MKNKQEFDMFDENLGLEIIIRKTVELDIDYSFLRSFS
jgi:hypothetical protein